MLGRSLVLPGVCVAVIWTNMAIAHSADNPRRSYAWLFPATVGVVALSAGVAWFPPLAFLTIAVAAVVLAVRYLETLCVLAFWALPYMVLNLPTGFFTLKTSEVVAYLLAAAVLARAILRREWPSLPPATLPVLVYLAVCAVSLAYAPPVPAPYAGGASDRSSPNFKGITTLIWLGLSWLVVVAVHHVAGGRPAVFWRCLRAHILSGGVASVVSVTMYGLALGGMQIVNTGGLGITRNLVPKAGDVLRLAGVAYEPLMLALYLLTVIPVTLTALLMFPEWMPRWLSASCLIAQMVAMILTFSTGGWIALIIALAILTPLIGRARLSRRGKMGLAAGALVFVSLAGAIFFVQQNYLDRLFQTFAKASAGGDPIRQGEWQSGIGMASAYPILGVGLGMSGFHVPRYHPALQSQLTEGRTVEVNNLYLNVAAETGILGLAALVCAGLAGIAALAGVTLRRGIAAVPVLTALTASLVGCAVHYNGVAGLFIIYLPALIGLACAAHRVGLVGIENPPVWRLAFWR
jgi:O-antigen ligase